jgi:L-asparaginase II
MTATPPSVLAGAVAPIAIAVRSGFEESLHHGVGIALAADGAPTAGVGAPTVVVYPRSCLKPLQARAMLAVGLVLTDRQLAIACASHDGSPDHLAVVREILERYDLRESDLDNTPSRPSDPVAREAARRAGTEPSSLQQNCSGKHAAMLATCRVNDWPVADYRRFDHPVQVAISAGIAAAGCVVDHVGVDGCGAPTHAFALHQLASAFGRIAAADAEDDPGAAQVARSMSQHPDLVGGPTRDVTQWMRAVPGLIAKDGAAGVFAAALPDGRAAAFKIADGSNEARRAVVGSALSALGVDVAGSGDDGPQRSVPVLGRGRAVGHVSGLDWTPCTT